MLLPQHAESFHLQMFASSRNQPGVFHILLHLLIDVRLLVSGFSFPFKAILKFLQ